MKKVIIEFMFITFIILCLFKYNYQIKLEMENIFYFFIKNILPSMFPMIFVSNYIKYNLLNKYNNKILKYLSLVFSFAPSNAVISSSSKELLYSSNINPLFSYVILITIFNKEETFFIIAINLIINYILLYKNTYYKDFKSTHKNITDLTKITMESIINIFGITVFFSIIISLLQIFIPKELLFFIEITNGFIILKNIKNILIKKIFLIFLNSFCGLAIFFQIKSLNESASFKLLFKKLLISIIVTSLTITILILL